MLTEVDLVKGRVKQHGTEKEYIEELKAQSAFDSEGNEDGIENPLDREKFELDKQKRKDDYVTKMKALDDDMKKHKDMKLKDLLEFTDYHTMLSESDYLAS